LRDIASGLAAHGALGSALSSPVTGYSVVYHLEMLLLFLTLVAIGPLVGRRRTTNDPPRKFGLADLPG
jgi:BCD family chlorophyll transporter-like MFS transporter